MNSIFLCNSSDSVGRVYANGHREKVAELTDLVIGDVISCEDFAKHRDALAGVEVVFSTWGMPCLTADQLAFLPRLKAVFYAAGSVRAFAKPLLDRDIVVVSGWQANAVPVAEYTLAQILLANKCFFANAAQCSTSHEGRLHARKARIRGNFGATVALLGAGAIGRKVIELLKPFTLRVVVWDPFLSEDHAARLGVAKVGTLGEAFAAGQVVSNHLANLPETVGMIREEHFRTMRQDATFINTGRGATVDEPGLVRVFAERTDLTALLDVTHPEPPTPDSPLFSLPNIFLTSHIAGSIGDEVVRMADFVIADFVAWRDGRQLKYQVTPELFATMA